VTGDVFAELDEETLAELDRYEGSHEYRRISAEAWLESGERVECWIYEYLGPVTEADRIPSGVWTGD
jgi:gamma-glutamylcyclotransferase (GGCT)/AIG2-like uncharacterized protein YtfP